MTVGQLHLRSVFTGVALASLASLSLTANAASSSIVIGQFLGKGAVTLGEGVTQISVKDNVHPYFEGDKIVISDSASGVLRLKNEAGVISMAANTTAKVSAQAGVYSVTADGSGLRFLFKKGTAFRVTMDCYTVEPGANAGLKKVTNSADGEWVGGAIMAVKSGTYVQGVRGDLKVTTAGASNQTVAAGDQYRGCNGAGGIVKTAAKQTVPQKNLSGWAIGAGVAAIAALGSNSSNGNSSGGVTLSTKAEDGTVVALVDDTPAAPVDNTAPIPAADLKDDTPPAPVDNTDMEDNKDETVVPTPVVDNKDETTPPTPVGDDDDKTVSEGGEAEPVDDKYAKNDTDEPTTPVDDKYSKDDTGGGVDDKGNVIDDGDDPVDDKYDDKDDDKDVTPPDPVDPPASPVKGGGSSKYDDKYSK